MATEKPLRTTHTPWPAISTTLGLIVALLGAIRLIDHPTTVSWGLLGVGLVAGVAGLLSAFVGRQKATAGLVGATTRAHRLTAMVMALSLVTAFIGSLWPFGAAMQWAANVLTGTGIAVALWAGIRIARNGVPSEYRQAARAYQEGHLDQALEALDKVDADSDGDHSARLLRIEILRAQGHSNRAIDDARRLIELAPDSYHGYAELGLALMDQHKPQDAVRPLGRAAELAPALAQAHYNLGLAYVASKRPAEAATTLAAALRLGLRDGVAEVIARYHVYRLLQEMDRLAESQAELRRLKRHRSTLRQWRTELERGPGGSATRHEHSLIAAIERAIQEPNTR